MKTFYLVFVFFFSLSLSLALFFNLDFLTSLFPFYIFGIFVTFGHSYCMIIGLFSLFSLSLFLSNFSQSLDILYFLYHLIFSLFSYRVVFSIPYIFSLYASCLIVMFFLCFYLSLGLNILYSL